MKAKKVNSMENSIHETQNEQDVKVEKLTQKDIKTLTEDEIVDKVMSKILEIK